MCKHVDERVERKRDAGQLAEAGADAGSHEQTCLVGASGARVKT